MSAGRDALDELASTLDALDEHVRSSDANARRSETNRLSMLHVHAAYAMFIAPLFAAIGREGMQGPIWAAARHIPGVPLTLAVALFAGGLILAVATWYRAVVWEMVGLWVLLSWYATISTSFAAALTMWMLRGMPPGANMPAPYVPMLYAHFVTIMAVHLRTLHRAKRARRQDPA